MSNPAPSVQKDHKIPTNGLPTQTKPAATTVKPETTETKPVVTETVSTKPSKKDLFERYYSAHSKVEKAEMEVSTTLKLIREHYGKGPFRLKEGVKTIVEREHKDDAGNVTSSLYYFRAVGGEIQEID